mgnify:CR=1 FL=1
MACRFPYPAARRPGEKPIIFRVGERPNPLAEGWDALELPCGQCVSCRLEKARVWMIRIMHEAAWLEEEHGLYSSFITLTYSEKFLPMYGTLVPKHLQDFFKRFRRRIEPRKVRYYACGEYGSRCVKHEISDCPACGAVQRPHYHAIVLGFDFPDRHYVGEREGFFCYESKLLSELWPYGFHEIGSCSCESAGYVARYVMKKQTGRSVEEGYYLRYEPLLDNWFEVEPEFAVMSRRPGIGRPWLEKYKEEMYPADEVCIPGRGVFKKPPRYYDEIYGLSYPEEMEKVKAARKEFFDENVEKGPDAFSKALVEDAKLKLLRRKL